MKFADALHRLIGLARLATKALMVHGKVVFDSTLLVSPSVKLFVSRNSKVSFGSRVVISYDSDICAVNGGHISVGKDVYFGPRCMLSAHSEIVIGEGSLLGPDVKIFDNNHDFVVGQGVINGRHRSAAVHIGKNVWIGANAIILKGVSVGDGAVVGAGEVVRQSVESGAVLGGTKR